ncbi:MAG: hypothetical protein M1835_005287 [Candelina submexicana]|nr:MAG: hypothetical protein M1835_005287 [Candelina submexicana]
MSMASKDWLSERHSLTELLYASPYDLVLYFQRSIAYEHLGFPDLAAGDAYRSLLLTDEVQEESGEYHEEAKDALRAYLEGQNHSTDGCYEEETNLVTRTVKLKIREDGEVGHEEEDLEDHKLQFLVRRYSLQCHQILARCLAKTGCQKSAFDFCTRGLAVFPADKVLLRERDHILEVHRSLQKREAPNLDAKPFDPKDLSDQGSARRELYPWNNHEPDRFSDDSLRSLNAELSAIAPKCEVRATELPLLPEDDSTKHTPIIKQLGIFAKEKIAPGETLLCETSLLTANNRLHESLCDACSSSLPTLADPAALVKVVSCPDCDDILFCNDSCLDQALASYHSAVCGKDVDAIGKDTAPHEAANALYLLLLARTLAMAETQSVHPLELKEVKFIWGDFVPTDSSYLHSASATDFTTSRHLPFSLSGNILGPIHLLEKMDVNIFHELERYDTWVLNTLYAKFRGTASARLSLRDGRPEVSAVHPMWCLANHSCDPNVAWEWGGEMRFWARDCRVAWGDVGGKEQRAGGIKEGEEVLNHYCDINLGVKNRRDWAIGALGGICMCSRCVWEVEYSNRLNTVAASRPD